MSAGAAPLRMGVVGCADIAIRRLLPAMARHPDVELTAVASRDAAKAEATARPYGCRAVHGYSALLASDVEAVYLPLPCALHATWVQASLAAGKHVLAEKPLTASSARTCELFAQARSSRLALMENVMFVHHPQHDAVRLAIDDGRIGGLRAVRAEFTIPRRPESDIRYQTALGGGALLDTGVYPVRAALHLLGRNLEVVGAVLTRGPGFDVDTAGAALLRSPDGVVVQLAFGLDHGYRSVYEVIGSRGRITLPHAFTPPADHKPVLRIDDGSDADRVRLPAHDQIASTLSAFAAAARAGGSPEYRSSLATVSLLERIRRHAGWPG